jgi:hypothetical protein
MCVAPLPRACVPLWQVPQVPGVTAVWLNVAGIHAVVRWHTSQAALVATCVAGLPRACVPLWQVAQVPAATPVWLKVAGVHAVVRWHVSHVAVVTM